MKFRELHAPREGWSTICHSVGPGSGPPCLKCGIQWPMTLNPTVRATARRAHDGVAHYSNLPVLGLRLRRVSWPIRRRQYCLCLASEGASPVNRGVGSARGGPPPPSAARRFTIIIRPLASAHPAVPRESHHEQIKEHRRDPPRAPFFVLLARDPRSSAQPISRNWKRLSERSRRTPT